MSRYINDFVSSKPDAQIKFIADDFFNKEGFTLTNLDGDYIFKKGIGMLTAPQFIKLCFQESRVHIEAWIKFPILPGVYLGEYGTKGLLFVVPKKMLESNVNNLLNLIR